MKGETGEILLENAKEYYRNAVSAEDRKEFNSSVTLFFKCISSLADLFVFRDSGKIPSSHTDRFRILEFKFPEIYKIVDINFPFYQGSYRSKLNLETSKMLRKDAERLFTLLGINY
jgi:hypothetical protein